MSKIKAFTILEMLISLAITSIIISLVYFTYSTFADQMYRYQKTTNEAQEFQQFYNQLKLDIFKAEKIILKNDIIHVTFYDGRIINYKIENLYLERIDGHRKDQLPTTNLEFSKLNDTSNLVTKITISTELYNEPLIFEVIKAYPPNLTIQL